MSLSEAMMKEVLPELMQNVVREATQRARSEATQEALIESTQQVLPDSTQESNPESTDDSLLEASLDAFLDTTHEAIPKEIEHVSPETTQDASPETTQEDFPEAKQEAIPEVIEDNQALQAIETERTERIIKHINDCLVPKLAKNYDESETHAEFDSRNSNLNKKIKTVIEEFEKYDIKTTLDKEIVESDKVNTIRIVSCLLNLYKELMCRCSWNLDNSKECAKKLNNCFYVKCKIKLDDVLKKNEICNSQAVYDKTLDDLCRKLTLDDFKKYPGQVEVYCDLVQNIKDFNVTVNPIKILPAALILMDDYIESNKTKGLMCCQVLLKKMTAKDFENGNYYDVIYSSIKNALNHKDVKITELSQACALELCQIFPSDIKDEKLDEMYTAALEHLSTESNLYRKAAFFRYTKKLMQMLEIKCVGKSTFKTIICDAIENCLIDSVAEILLIPSLQCLEEWIKHCWPVWKLPVDFKVLCALLKYYSKCNTGEGGLFVQKLIVTLVSLCTPEEQKQFTAQLEGKDEEENTKMDGLKKDIGVNTNLD